MNKFSNILKIPIITSHSNGLIKRIENKINDRRNLEEKALSEIKRDDIVYTHVEYPQIIIIEPDFDKINVEKVFGNTQKNYNIFNLNENENKSNQENSLILMDVEEQMQVKQEVKEKEKIDYEDNLLNEDKVELYNGENARGIVEAKEAQAPDNYKNFKSKSIYEIKESDKVAVLTLNVLDYYPKNVLDFCMIFCPECQER